MYVCYIYISVYIFHKDDKDIYLKNIFDLHIFDKSDSGNFAF